MKHIATKSRAGLMGPAHVKKLDDPHVTSINGMTGAVSLTASDVGAAASNHSHANATTSASGFMSATDKSKLDGIEAGANVTNASTVGSAIHGSSAKATPVDADTVALIDSAASNTLKKLSWANIKATLKTYFDTLYAAVGHSHSNATTSAAGFMSATDKQKLDGVAAGATANTGTVTSVQVSVPTGLQVSGGPITTSGTLTISYASGYQGYTTAEASKLAGIQAGAQVNAVTSVAGRTGAVTLSASDISGLGNAATRNVGTTSGTVAAGDDSRIAGALQRSGGTMTGELTLSGNPTSNLHAATKQYVDNNALLKSGGTMTGALTLSGDPTSDLHAATKQYVDNAVASVPTSPVGLYTGSSANETNLPVGHHVFVVAVSAINRNASATVRLTTDSNGYTPSGSGSLLSGTWRARGFFGGDDSYQILMQRTA